MMANPGVARDNPHGWDRIVAHAAHPASRPANPALGHVRVDASKAVLFVAARISRTRSGWFAGQTAATPFHQRPSGTRK